MLMAAASSAGHAPGPVFGAAQQLPLDRRAVVIGADLYESPLNHDREPDQRVAEQLGGPDRESAWRSIATDSARFAQYRTKTGRELLVIRLTPRQ